jgi:hypothetical protein
MNTASQRLWFPWTSAAERTTLEVIEYGCDITAALITELRSATSRRFERLRIREQTSTSLEATSCSHTRERIVRYADLEGIASGAFKHYFLIADDELLSEDVQLAIRAFQQFRGSHPEFESFRLIVVGAVGPVSQQEAKSPGRFTDEVENVRCYQLTGGEEEFSRLYRYCYAMIATSQPKNAAASLEGRRFSKPIITISRAEHDENPDRDYCGLLCEATPEALALSMAQVARGSGCIDGATG